MYARPARRLNMEGKMPFNPAYYDLLRSKDGDRALIRELSATPTERRRPATLRSA